MVGMRTRYAALGAIIWTIGFLAAYLLIVRGQGNEPAWWYVAVPAVAALCLIPASAGRPGANTGVSTGVGTVLLAGATLLGLLSVGLLLVPAVAAAAVAWASGRDQVSERTPESEPLNPLT
jgi:hypothetical protein